jgi:hypothetical protein
MKALITLKRIDKLEDDKVHLSGSVPVPLLMSLVPAHPLPVLNPVKREPKAGAKTIYSRKPFHCCIPRLLKGIRPCLSDHGPCRNGSVLCLSDHGPCRNNSVPCLNDGRPCRSGSRPCLNDGRPCRNGSRPCLNDGRPCRSGSRPCLNDGRPCRSGSRPCLNDGRPYRSGSRPVRNDRGQVFIEIKPAINNKKYKLKKENQDV